MHSSKKKMSMLKSQIEDTPTSPLLGLLLGLELGKLPLAPAPVGIGTSFGVEHVVPPAEAG